MRKNTTTTSKIVAGAVSFAMAFSFVFGGAVAPVQAQTVEELTAQINGLLSTIASLQSNLAALTGGSTTTTTATGYTFTRSLKQGDTGADVMQLQKFLNMDPATQVSTTGAGSPGNESSYFGPATKAAVIKFQNKYAASVLAPVGLSAGTGYFGPSSIAKANMMNASTGTTTGGTTGGTTTVPTGSTLNVTLGSGSTASVLVSGQAIANLANFTFTNTSGTDAKVTKLVFDRTGISNDDTLTGVYLYDGVTRLTDSSTASSAMISISNSVGLFTVPAGSSKTIAVRADVKTGTAGQVIGVALRTVESNVAVAASLPLSSTPISIATADLATVSLSANTVSTSSVDAGITQYTFWSAPVQINTRVVNLEVANFRIIGSAPSDAIQNIQLFVDGVNTNKTATMKTIDGSNYAVFDLSAAPLALSTGSHTLDVRGDVVKGSDRTVQFSVQQVSDLVLTDSQINNVHIAMTGTVPNSAGVISINEGSVTANLDASFQSLTTVTGGASNVAIAKFKIRAYGEDVKFNTVQILPVLSGTTPGTGGLDNVALYFNGSQIGSLQDWTSGNLTYTPGSQMVAVAGVDSVLEVRADVRTSTSINYTAGTISANLVVGSSNAQGESSKTTVSSPAVTGNTLSIQTGLLAVAKNNAYANTDIQPNKAGTKIASFTLQNQSSSEGVRITSLVVAPLGAGSAVLTDISGLRTSLTSGSGATPQQPQTSNTFSVNHTLGAGETLTVDILADTGSATSGTFIPTLNVSSIGATSNVTATSGAIIGQTVTLSTGTLSVPAFVTSSSDVAQLIPAANGGAADASSAVFNFKSTGGTATISELKFTDAVSNATQVKVGNATAPFVGGVAYLTGLNLAVPQAGSGLNQVVTISYPEVGTSGVSSLATSTVGVTYVKYSSGGTTVATTTSQYAPVMTLVGSKPAFTVTDSSDNLSNGQIKLAEVTVTADAKGDVKLGKLPVSVTSTGVATVATSTNNIVVKDTNGTVIATTNDSFGVYAGGTGTSTITFGSTDAASYLIPAGTSKTFRIYATAATVSGAVNTTSLSTTLGAAASVEWYDVAGSNTTAISASSVFNYPTNTSTVTN